MPVIKIQHVVSFSSEDKVHKAENLLKSETYRKWKCATAGEKQASVILQLEKASVISSIDIGNESSAFIEVLVSRSSDTTPDFQVLLVASSFMSPMDCRQNTNLNRVRMFGSDKLSQALAKQKWDRIKVVCTQPFNRSIQYGLAFITLHSPGDPDAKGSPSPNAPLGSFRVQEEEEEETDLAVGSWFAKQKNRPTQDSSTSPAAIKGASFAATVLRSAEEKSLKPQPQKASQLHSPSMKSKEEKQPEQQSSEARKKAAGPSPKPSLKPAEKILAQVPKKGPAEQPSSKVANHETKKRKAQPRFQELMKKVVFVLSGFQNPTRSQIRDKALEMGAKYKGDWDATCTHLVCAFLNTPKYGQVKAAGGRIVTKDWVLECHRERRLLPWRQYRLGSYDLPETSEESDEEDGLTEDVVASQSRSPRKRPAGSAISPRPSSTTAASEDDTPSKKLRRHDGELVAPRFCASKFDTRGLVPRKLPWQAPP